MPEKLILKCNLCPGDVLMLTAAVRDLHAAHPGRFLTDVRTPHPALWQNSPHLTPIPDGEGRVVEMHYPLINRSNQTPHHFIHGYRKHLESVLGVNIEAGDFRGDIHLAKEEREWMSQVEEIRGAGTRFWIIVSGGKSDFTAKHWDAARWQAVVDAFPELLFVQVGEAKDIHPALNGVLDLRGKTNLRQLIRLVYHADGVLCPVTSLMHLAAAVPWKHGAGLRPCVVVAGGREPAHWEAYPGHRYLDTIGQLPCCATGGCWKSRTVPLGDGDDKDKSLCERPVLVREGVHIAGCLDRITAAHVIEAIRGYLLPAPPVVVREPVKEKGCCGSTQTAGKINNTDPKSWGPPMWREFHRHPPDDPINSGKEWYKLGQFAGRIPCKECRQRLEQWIVANPPDFSSCEAFSRWKVEAHNEVNRQLGKPVLTFEQAAATFPPTRHKLHARVAICVQCEHYQAATATERPRCGKDGQLLKPKMSTGNCEKWPGWVEPVTPEVTPVTNEVTGDVPEMSFGKTLGVVIGTFAALPYIHLQLEAARRLYPNVAILVHDDGSPQREQLALLCQQYGADFVGADERKAQFLGDLSAYRAGILWAQERGIEYLLKLSRRWIWTVDWTRSFFALAAASDGDTVSHHCLANGFGFRTECVGFRVAAWTTLPAWVAAKLAADVNIFVEFDLHRLAEQVAAKGSDKWRAYDDDLARAADRRGYAPWLLMGDSRHTATDSHLWHNSHGPHEYAYLAASWGLHYTAADFADPNAGCGSGYAPRK